MAKRSGALLAGSPGPQGPRLRRILSRLGCPVRTVKRGEDLLRLVKRTQPALILLGPVVGHPGRAALCRLLKTDARARGIPVLALLDFPPTPGQWRQVALADEVVCGSAPASEVALRIRTLLRLYRLAGESRRALRLIRARSRLDDLTRLPTHGAFKERLARELHRASRYRRPLSLLMVDVDHFKHYNDGFGHPAGDRLLRRVARIAAGALRRVDFGARYGGDEFSVILPETPHVAAAVVAERIRTSIEKHPFSHRQSQPLGCVTVSIGVATYPEAAGAGERLVEAADRALYQAKAEGRNCIRGARSAPPPARTEAP